MGIEANVESTKGNALCRVAFGYVATLQIVARVDLVVAYLKLFVRMVVLPPRAVETCSVGEVSV